jgi:hypothetical protein
MTSTKANPGVGGAGAQGIAETSCTNSQIARPTQAGHNLLADLASRIRAEHEAADAAIKSSVEHAIVAGILLIEAKDLVKHGQWLPWLAEHCAISDRTARVYMRLARHKDQIGSSAADLSLREAVAFLADLAYLREQQSKINSGLSRLKDLAAKCDEVRYVWIRYGERISALAEDNDRLLIDPDHHIFRKVAENALEILGVSLDMGLRSIEIGLISPEKFCQILPHEVRQILFEVVADRAAVSASEAPS